MMVPFAVCLLFLTNASALLSATSLQITSPTTRCSLSCQHAARLRIERRRLRPLFLANDEVPPIEDEPSSESRTRRQFILSQILTSLLLPSNSYASSDVSTYFSLSNNNNISPYTTQRQSLSRQSQKDARQLADRQQKVSNIANTKKWIPFHNYNKWNTVEKCLLEMLPVKNGVFRKLQELIENLTVYEPDDSEGWKQTLLDVLTVLSLLESKRSSLEPVFNQEDPTALFISKSSIGETNIEALRIQLEELVQIASGGANIDVEVSRQNASRGGSVSFIPVSGMDNLPIIDVRAFEEGKKKALFTLAEVGELLVTNFPYAVPSGGKFGNLPRLLGRCTVTFSFERPSNTAASGFGLFDTSLENKRSLGNVTIVADGYAAPITAGNFVDLGMRNFYTGLSVKAMRKRLGLIPSWSDNVIVNDLTELKDNLDVLADDFGSDLTNAERKLRFFQTKESVEAQPFGFDSEDSRVTMDAVLPILGSFQEGFYDPLTAKPRRIPLELVALDPASPTKAALTYSASFASLDVDVAATGTTTTSVLKSSSSNQRSFSSAISPTSYNSTTTASGSNLNPVLTFDIPNLVALNHPDRVSNGGSSEFFALPLRDISSKKTKLLDGQYAPFGYIVGGADVYNSLRPGDVIKATYVSELGQLNLVKIRKNAFESSEGEEILSEDAVEEKEN
eukprot:scaffold7697_cov76-Cyclotella_meneghiniana.AAC.2